MERSTNDANRLLACVVGIYVLRDSERQEPGAGAAGGPQFKAEVEEWWESPALWRREIHSTSFTQTLVVNGSRTYEQDFGDVFPELLRNLTVELVDTVPRFDQLAALHQRVERPDGKSGQIRARWEIPGSDGTVRKTIAASLAISRETGLMMYGGDIDWDVSLHEFSDFHGKRIARLLTAQSKGGPRLAARIALLEDLPAADKGLFTIKKSTPQKLQLRVQVVPEPDLRKLIVAAPAPNWPPISSGPASGAMIMRVVVDRSGRVRSVDDFFSDNPSLQSAAEDGVMLWRFRPFKVSGVPVQVISTITLPFHLE